MGAVLLGQSSPQPSWLPATVASFTAGSSATVLLDGGSVTVNATLAWNDSFAVGDRVWVARAGTQLMIVGRQNFYGGGAVIPVGTLLATMAATADTGFLMLDGSTHNATDFPAFALKVYSISVGTFTLPDARGKTLAAFLASDPVFGTRLAVVGEAANSHTHTAAAHTHTAAAHVHSLSDAGQADVSWAAGGQILLRRVTAPSWTATVTSTSTTAVPLSGSSTATTNSVGLTGATDSTTPGASGSTAPGAGSAPSDTSNVQPTVVIGGWQVKT